MIVENKKRYPCVSLRFKEADYEELISQHKEFEKLTGQSSTLNAYIKMMTQAGFGVFRKTCDRFYGDGEE